MPALQVKEGDREFWVAQTTDGRICVTDRVYFFDLWVDADSALNIPEDSDEYHLQEFETPESADEYSVREEGSPMYRAPEFDEDMALAYALPRLYRKPKILWLSCCENAHRVLVATNFLLSPEGPSEPEWRDGIPDVVYYNGVHSLHKSAKEAKEAAQAHL